MQIRVYDKKRSIVKPKFGPPYINYICIESNAAWALPYWKQRQELNPNLVIEIIDMPQEQS